MPPNAPSEGSSDENPKPKGLSDRFKKITERLTRPVFAKKEEVNKPLSPECQQVEVKDGSVLRYAMMWEYPPTNNPDNMIEALQRGFAELRTRIYGPLSKLGAPEDPASILAAFCSLRTEDITLRRDFIQHDRSLTKQLELFFNISLSRTPIPPFIRRQITSNQLATQWLESLEGNGSFVAQHMLLQAFHEALLNYVNNHHSGPEKQPIVSAPLPFPVRDNVRLEDPAVRSYMDILLERRAEKLPVTAKKPVGHIADFLPRPEGRGAVLDRLRLAVPSRMDHRALYSTALYVRAICREVLREFGGNPSVFQALQRMNAHLLDEKYLRLEGVTDYPFEEDGSLDAPKVAAKNVFLWLPFRDISDYYKMRDGKFFYPENPTENDFAIDERDVVYGVMALRDAFLKSETIDEVMERFMSDIPARYIYKGAKGEQSPFADRLRRFQRVANIVIRDENLLKFLDIFMKNFRNCTREQWDRPRYKIPSVAGTKAFSPFDLLKQMAEVIFDPNSSTDQAALERYQLSTLRVEERWRRADISADELYRANSNRALKALAPLLTGWRRLIRERSVKLIYDVMAYMGFPLREGDFVISHPYMKAEQQRSPLDDSPLERDPEWCLTYEDMQAVQSTRLALTLLLIDIQSGARVHHVPSLRRKA